MSYTRDDLQQLVDKWGEKARAWMVRDTLSAQRVANAYFECVDDLIDLITFSPNELRSGV